MRIAIVSDIHGNLTAFNAVLEDLRSVAPDLVLHGGDLGHGGPRPAEVVERIRELAWRGVMGNVDEMTVRPKSFEDFIRPAPQLDKMWNAIREVAVWTRAQHSTEQIEWLGSLPIMQVEDDVALVHASPTTTWCSPDPEASNAEFEVAYGSIPRALVVYGHV